MARLKKTDEQVLIAMAQLIDASDPNVWPPPMPTIEELAEKTGMSWITVKNRLKSMTNVQDPPYIVRTGQHRYGLTVKAIEFMASRGYLRRYVKRTDAGWGVVVAKLGLVYPT